MQESPGELGLSDSLGGSAVEGPRFKLDVSETSLTKFRKEHAIGFRHFLRWVLGAPATSGELRTLQPEVPVKTMSSIVQACRSLARDLYFLHPQLGSVKPILSREIWAAAESVHATMKLLFGLRHWITWDPACIALEFGFSG